MSTASRFGLCLGVVHFSLSLFLSADREPCCEEMHSQGKTKCSSVSSDQATKLCSMFPPQGRCLCCVRQLESRATAEYVAVSCSSVFFCEAGVVECGKKAKPQRVIPMQLVATRY